MLGASESVRKKRVKVLRERADGKLTADEAGNRLIETDPDSAFGYLMLADSRADAGRSEDAEELLWKALERAPCGYTPYLALVSLYSQTDPDGVMPVALMGLAFWKAYFSDEVPEELADILRRQTGEAGDPESFARLAEGIEAGLEMRKWPERLLAYRLFNEVQRQAAGGLDPDVLHEILANAAVCAPVFRAALREWADTDNTALSDEAAGMTLALLGEMAGPALVDDLLDSAPRSWTTFVHGQWAIWRIGQRFPDETFAKLTALGRGPDPGLRATIAEQLYLLPDIPGRREAILALLEGFSAFGKTGDAPYLLLTVSTLLAMLGAVGDSAAILQRHDRFLSKEGRKWMGDVLSSEDAFVPNLTSAGIPDVDIEAVCVSGALLDEEELGDDEEFEDDEVFAEPAIAALKPGRNDPCWCGSGKKYKKCHLAEDEKAERSGIKPEPPATTEDRLYGKVWMDLLRAAKEWHSRSERAESMDLYFAQDASELDPVELPDSGYFEWYVMDYRPERSGRTVVEEFLRRHGPRLPGPERALLESWSGARFGMWEVQKIERGRGVEVLDVFEGDRFFVHDVSTSKSAATWDCIVTRIHQLEGKWFFAGNGTGLDRTLLDRVKEEVESESREAGMTAGEYVRSRSHEWRRRIEGLHAERMAGLRIVNFEGDPIELGTAEYEVTDAERVAGALGGLKMFDETTAEDGEAGVRSFAWIETGPAGDDGRRSYGSIEIGAGKLRLSCNSRRRLGIGRQLVEKHGGEFVRHLGDTFESVDDLKRRVMLEKPQPAAPKRIDPEIERKLIEKVKSKHYARWVDEPLPALNGQTPREAVKSEVGRRSVEDLLRGLENREERERQEGRAAFDCSELRRSLGL